MFTQETYDEMVVVRDMDFPSMCEHHLLPFTGRADFAYIPNGRVVGLSKIPRVVETLAKRPQLQEPLTSRSPTCCSTASTPRAWAWCWRPAIAA